MAYANYESRPVTKYERVLVLQLTEREASVLRTVCRNIGGSPTKTARGITDAIEVALGAAGVEPATDVVHNGMDF